MNERIYLSHSGACEVRLRPRPADRPFTFELQNNVLSGLKLDQQDLEYLDPETHVAFPLARDEEGQYFFKREWQFWLNLEAGRLGAAIRLIKKNPELWHSDDFPRQPKVLPANYLMDSGHSDADLVRIMGLLPKSLRDEQLHQALIHERPLLAEALWEAGARFGDHARSLHQAILTWLKPDSRRMAKHLGVQIKEGQRAQYETVPIPAHGPKTFAGQQVRVVAVMVADLWGGRLEEAAAHLPLHPQFPVLVTYTQGDEVTRHTVTHSWASYLLTFGQSGHEREMEWSTSLAIAQSQMARFNGMGLDLAQVRPPLEPGQTQPLSWVELGRQHYGNPEMEAFLRRAQTAAEPVAEAKRVRVRP